MLWTVYLVVAFMFLISASGDSYILRSASIDY